MARNTAVADDTDETVDTAVLPDRELDLGNDAFRTAIDRATELLDAKAAIQADLQTARDFLNQAKSMGILSEDQTIWVSAYLPRRSRKRKGVADDSE